MSSKTQRPNKTEELSFCAFPMALERADFPVEASESSLEIGEPALAGSQE